MKKFLSILQIFLLIFIAVPAAGLAVEQVSSASFNILYSDTSLLIKVDSSTDVMSIAPVASYVTNSELIMELTPEVSGEHSCWYEIEFSAVSTERMYSLLSATTCVLDINYNYKLCAPHAEPAERVFPQALPLADPYTCSVQQCYDFINENQIQGKGSGIVVAVLDTGIDYEHPDLVSKLWTNEGDIFGDGIDNDENGVIDDYYGPNFADLSRYDPYDFSGHGTHVAGIIAASSGETHLGIAPDVTIMPIKVLGESTYLSNVIKGIRYATLNDADIINMSLSAMITSGAMLPESTATALTSALQEASGSALLFAAAGNSGLPNNDFMDLQGSRSYPASMPQVIGVMNELSSPGAYGWLHPSSNWDTLTNPDYHYELMAPGTSVYSTYSQHTGMQYATMTGTSMSTPFAAGVGAIVLSVLRSSNPDISVSQVHDLLVNCGRTKLGLTQEGTELYYKEVNAFNCISPETELSLSKAFLLDNSVMGEKGYLSQIGIELKNNGADAVIDQVTVTCRDTNVVFDKDTVTMKDIWSLETGNNGITYTNGTPSAISDPFLFHYISTEDIPASLEFTFTVLSHVPGHDTQCIDTFTKTLNTVNARVLPKTLTEEFVFSPGNTYYVRGPVEVPQGKIVTIPEGTTLQFGSGNETDAALTIKGTLTVKNSTLVANEINSVSITDMGGGYTSIENTSISSPSLQVSSLSYCTLFGEKGYKVHSSDAYGCVFQGLGKEDCPADIYIDYLDFSSFDNIYGNIGGESISCSLFRNAENTTINSVYGSFDSNSIISPIKISNTPDDAIYPSGNYWGKHCLQEVISYFAFSDGFTNNEKPLDIPSSSCYPFLYRVQSSADELTGNMTVDLYYNRATENLPIVTAIAHGDTSKEYSMEVSHVEKGHYTASGHFAGVYSSVDFSADAGLCADVPIMTETGLSPIQLTGKKLYTTLEFADNKISGTVKNNSGLAVQYTPVIALYSGKKLVNIIIGTTAVLRGYKTADLSLDCTPTDFADTIKVFIINRPDKLTPYINPIVYTRYYSNWQ